MPSISSLTRLDIEQDSREALETVSGEGFPAPRKRFFPLIVPQSIAMAVASVLLSVLIQTGSFLFTRTFYRDASSPLFSSSLPWVYRPVIFFPPTPPLVVFSSERPSSSDIPDPKVLAEAPPMLPSLDLPLFVTFRFQSAQYRRAIDTVAP